MRPLKNYKPSAEQLLLVLILLVAVTLRFFRWFDIPLTYDEYSSLYRVSELGDGELSFFQRVRLDAHPALHHIIVYLLRDMPAAILKLPFLLVGCLSVYLTYLAGKRWFSLTTGLLAAACLAVMQPAIMHAQIARPYALGLVFCLALLVSLKGAADGKRAAAFWSALWFALAMYSHYFAGFSAGVTILAVLVLERKSWKSILAVGVLGLILFSPHLPITIAQLGHGDLGTVVATPSWDWFFYHLAYNVHYSWVFGISVLGIGIWVWVSGGELVLKKRSAFKLIWFLPFLLGLIYSLVAGPILQHRILLFGLPFLLMAVFASSQSMPARQSVFAVLTLLLIGGGTLIWKRHHFQTFYQREYAEVLDAAFADIKQAPDPSHLRMVSYHPFILKKQIVRIEEERSTRQRHQKIFQPLYEVDSFLSKLDSTKGIDEIRNDIRSANDRAFFGWTGHYDRPAPEILGMLLERFPHAEASDGYHNGQWFWLRENSTLPLTKQIIAETEWNFEDGRTYGKEVSLTLHPDSLPGWVLCHASVEHDNDCSAQLVCEVKREGETIFYRSRGVQDFKTQDSESTTVHLGVFMEDLRGETPDEVFIYWHNPKGDSFTAGDLTVREIPHNKWLYSLTEPIEE